MDSSSARPICHVFPVYAWSETTWQRSSNKRTNSQKSHPFLLDVCGPYPAGLIDTGAFAIAAYGLPTTVNHDKA